MKVLGLSLDDEINVSRRSQIKHALIGGLYGLTAGTVFALFAAFVDLLLHPDLPLGADYESLSQNWLSAGLGLALIGFATCWAVVTWKGLMLGAGTAGALTLIAGLFGSQVSMSAKFLVLVFSLVPVAGFALPVAWILRWLGERHERARSSNRPVLNVFFLIMITTALGAAGGYFMKMPVRATTAIRFVDGLFQEAVTNAKSILRQIPGFADHINTGYKMYESPSSVSTEGFAITAKFDDGYQVVCDVVLYPERDPFLSSCAAESHP